MKIFTNDTNERPVYRIQSVHDQCMENIVPAKLQHLARLLSITTNEGIEPTLDLETNRWSIKYVKLLECSDLLHELLFWESGESYDNCTAGHHDYKIEIVSRRVGKKSTRPRWNNMTQVVIDNQFNLGFDLSLLMSLLADPTNPQGEGKVNSEVVGDNKQHMMTRTTTVIRV